MTALLFARPLALYRTGRVQSKYANVLSVKRRFDGISAHFVVAVYVVSVPVPVFPLFALVWRVFLLLLVVAFVVFIVAPSEETRLSPPPN